MKSGASSVKSSVMSSFQKVQKKADTLSGVRVGGRGRRQRESAGRLNQALGAEKARDFAGRVLGLAVRVFKAQTLRAGSLLLT